VVHHFEAILADDITSVIGEVEIDTRGIETRSLFTVDVTSDEKKEERKKMFSFAQTHAIQDETENKRKSNLQAHGP